MNPKGVITRPSSYTVNETINRLQAFVLQHGATVYARINQRTELQKAGIDILQLEFILFGNPKAGGLIMAQNPITALDLPLKVIAWQDEAGKTWLAYNEAAYMEDRYALPPLPNSPLLLDGLIDHILA